MTRPEPVKAVAKKGPNCWDCRYLRITWDTRHPYACDFMGFQSRMLPCIEVLRADCDDERWQAVVTRARELQAQEGVKHG